MVDFEIGKLDKFSGVPLCNVEDLIALAILPFYLKDDRFAHSLFADCLSAFTDGSGSLYILKTSNAVRSFSFILESAGPPMGAAHLHVTARFQCILEKGSEVLC